MSIRFRAGKQLFWKKNQFFSGQIQLYIYEYNMLITNIESKANMELVFMQKTGQNQLYGMA